MRQILLAVSCRIFFVLGADHASADYLRQRRSRAFSQKALLNL
jgi:hypothetical protein